MRVSWSICVIGAAISSVVHTWAYANHGATPRCHLCAATTVRALYVRVLNHFRRNPCLFGVGQQLSHVGLVWNLDRDLGLTGSVRLAYPRRCHANT